MTFSNVFDSGAGAVLKRIAPTIWPAQLPFNFVTQP
jgi:hypothetical protein